MPTVEEQKALDARLIDHLGKNRDLVKAEQDLKDGANPDTQDIPHRAGQRVTLLSRLAVDMPALIMADKRLDKAGRKEELDILKQSITLLIKYDADVNFQNEDGKTILAQVRDAAENANLAGNKKLVEFYKELDALLLSKRARESTLKVADDHAPNVVIDGVEIVEGDVNGHHLRVEKGLKTGDYRIVEEGVGQVTVHADNSVTASPNTEKNAYEELILNDKAFAESLRQAVKLGLTHDFTAAERAIHDPGLHLSQPVKQKGGKGRDD
jgi:hypothetical protein